MINYIYGKKNQFLSYYLTYRATLIRIFFWAALKRKIEKKKKKKKGLTRELREILTHNSVIFWVNLISQLSSQP